MELKLDKSRTASLITDHGNVKFTVAVLVYVTQSELGTQPYGIECYHYSYMGDSKKTGRGGKIDPNIL